jgi:hypothetical protein
LTFTSSADIFKACAVSSGTLGQNLGISRQAVSSLLGRITQDGHVVQPRYPICCCVCNALIWKDGSAPQNGEVFCLGCLANRQEVTFGQRLKAHRVAAKLTQQR